MTEETTPLGTVTYTYDTFGRLSQKNNSGQYESYSYLYSSTTKYTNIPNAVTYKDGKAYNYTYDANGNITQITNRDKSDDITFEYDNVGRLTKESRYGKYTNTFTYDINGNITKKEETTYTNVTTGTKKTYNYTYTNGRLTGFDGKSCVYDANGNPTTYLGTACEWERGRLLKKFGNTSFAYDANGLRVKKGNKEYIWSGDRLIAEKENGEITTRYFYDSTGIAGYSYRGSNFKFRKNLQGDVIGIIDSMGTLLGTYEYDAWGNCTKVDMLVMGTTAVLSMNPFRYRGYYYDSETGLYYLQSRYYDPQTGRFISPDAYSYLQPDTVNGLNLYSYCNNNPVMNVDPSGNSFFGFLVGLAISSLIGWGLSEIFGLQIAGGISSIVGGGSAVYTGVGLLGFGPVGWIAGGALILIGFGTMMFGTNEIIAGVTGSNYIQNWTGMSDGLYDGLYISLNIASALGTIAGNIYMKYADVSGAKPGRTGKPLSRYSLLDNNGVKQYRYFDLHGNAWFDKDFRHGGKFKFPHYHGWKNGAKLDGHWSFWQLLKWLF